MASVLVIEDDPAAAGVIVAALGAEGYDVTAATSGGEGLALALARAFGAITLDRMLPGLDGLSLVTRLREEGVGTPVLMVSALSDVDERVAGLRAGGDDYLAKPFAPAELVARVAALLRRRAAPPEPMLRAGGVELDLIRRTATVAGQSVRLLHREFDLLAFFLRNEGRVVSRRMLFEQVWGYYFDPGANLIAVHIARLRRKLDLPDTRAAIETVKGEGYRFVAET